MSFLTKHRTGLNIVIQSAFLIGVFCFNFSLLSAQISNGVFDPSKVMVAKDKVKEIQSIEKNIEAAIKLNKTIGTPDSPLLVKPSAPTPNPAEIAVGNKPALENGPSYGPPPVSVPSFDLPPERRKRRTRESATVLANKLPPVDIPSINTAPAPLVSANPVAIRGIVPTYNAPPETISSAETPASDAPDVDLANATAPPSAQETRSWFGRLWDSFSKTPAPVEVASAEIPAFAPLPGEEGSTDAPTLETATDAPPGGAVSMNGTLNDVPPRSGESMSHEEGGTFDPNRSFSDLELPSYEDSSSRSGFLSRFNRGNRKKPLDIPDRPIPISIGRNTGNPYSDHNFQPGNGYSPLLDDPNQIRDMTQPGALPLAPGVVERLGQKPIGDLTQYMVVKSETLFECFIPGTEEVDPDNTFEIYPGASVKDLGITGLKRMVQVDSGEIGLVAKFSVRELSVSEEVVMSQGLAKGQRWYSILDTDAEMDQFAGAPSLPMIGGGPQRPSASKPVSLSNGKPDHDLSQYFVVRRNGVNFGAYGADSLQVDSTSAFEVPIGTLVKVISTPGDRHIVELDSGENGELLLDDIRPLSEKELAQMKSGLDSGQMWYSILDTISEAPASVTSKPVAPMGEDQKPKTTKPKTTIPTKPEDDISQYHIVNQDGILFQPFGLESTALDPNSAFEMFKGAVVKVISTADGNHVVQTDSGESGVIAEEGLRSLSDSETKQMAGGLSEGKAWYSILNTDATN